VLADAGPSLFLSLARLDRCRVVLRVSLDALGLVGRVALYAIPYLVVEVVIAAGLVPARLFVSFH
jgi:hypothetical protein